MLKELSLNVLDIAENSVRAEASIIEIIIEVSNGKDIIKITIIDNGKGMDNETLKNIVDPFFTSRKTRKVGLGIPFFKMAAETAGGTFDIESQKNIGTKVSATFQMSHIDRMPMGDIVTTIHNLVVYRKEIDFIFDYKYDEKSFLMDTREFREILGGLPFDLPEVSNYIKEFLEENKFDVDKGAYY